MKKPWTKEEFQRAVKRSFELYKDDREALDRHLKGIMTQQLIRLGYIPKDWELPKTSTRRRFAAYPASNRRLFPSPHLPLFPSSVE